MKETNLSPDTRAESNILYDDKSFPLTILQYFFKKIGRYVYCCTCFLVSVFCALLISLVQYIGEREREPRLLLLFRQREEEKWKGPSLLFLSRLSE